jgi:signal transduction histidine kinase
LQFNKAVSSFLSFISKLSILKNRRLIGNNCLYSYMIKLTSELISDIVLVLNVNGQIKFASHSVQLLGYKPQEMIGKDINNFSPDGEYLFSTAFEATFRQKNGKLISLNGRGQALKNIFGQTKGFVLIIYNNNLHRNTAENGKEQAKDAFLQKATIELNAYPHPRQAVSSVLKKIVSHNNFEGAAIYTLERKISSKIRVFKKYAACEQGTRFKECYTGTGEDEIFHNPSPAVSSSAKNSHLFSIPLKAEGKLNGTFIITAKDKLQENQLNFLLSIGQLMASALHKAELYRQLQLHSRFLAQMGEMVAVINRQEELIYINNVTASITGHDAEKILFKKITQIIPPEELPTYKNALSSLQIWGYWRGELKILNSKRSAVPFRMTASAFTDPEDNNWVSVWVGHDLSNLRHWEKQMEAMGKYTLIGEMAASIAHEIRNPLTTVRGFLQLLQSQNLVIKNEQQQKYYKLMIEEIDRASNIIGNYLNFARKDLPLKKKIELNQLIDHTAMLIENEVLLRNITLEIEKDDNEIFVNADTKQLQQVFLNIIHNALDAMNQGGTLTLKTAMKDKALVCIKDTGEGISKELQQTIFDPFFTTKGKGTGLGLSISRRIVQELGGDITFHSVPVKGTCFTVSLPLFEEQS